MPSLGICYQSLRQGEIIEASEHRSSMISFLLREVKDEGHIRGKGIKTQEIFGEAITEAEA